MSRRKVLYIVHNHPSVRPGGAETFALELYEAMGACSGYEPILLAKAGPPISSMEHTHSGTIFARVNADPNQYFCFTECSDYDWLNGTSPRKEQLVKFYADFLRATQPDVVHFQHTLFFGYDILRQTRLTLPNAPIVYTLHEYLPICHRQGQMLRTNDVELCDEESPRRCHECYPGISPQAFFMRKRFIQSQLSAVDWFLAPSHFLRQRFVEWGLPAEKVEFEEYGRQAVSTVVSNGDERPRNRFGFFGQFTFFKGVQVLLQAIQAAARPTDGFLWLGTAVPLLAPWGEPRVAARWFSE